MADSIIKLLDENTANRIAAGEVIERPASAVKELVENSIDAGATAVAIDLQDAGRSLIRVQDNGSGMTRTDAILALQRHATSKINSADDLFSIHTLGFRGEALPSIASVSLLTLLTKSSDEDTATLISVRGGDIESVQEAAGKDGTVIEICQLFFNTPARLKFLKSNQSELNRVLDIVGQLAVAYTGISFCIRHDGQEIFTTPGTGERLTTLAALWGREAARKLVPVRSEASSIQVTGYVATPEYTRPGRTHELFFVNNRPIKNRLLAHAVEEAMRSLTPESRYPAAAILLEIEPELVDVNVHPTKTEVKFTRDGEVHHAIYTAVKDSLLKYGIVPDIKLESSTDNLPSSSDSLFPNSAEGEGMGMLFPEREIHSAPYFGELPNTNMEMEELVEPRAPRPFAEKLREFRVIGQLRNTYIIALTSEGIAVVDQHVAHERVLYERLTVKRKTSGIPVQRLSTPSTIHLGRREAMMLADQLKSFAEAGWEIEAFGKESFMLRSIPALLIKKPYEQILRDMIDELIHQTLSRRLLVQQDHVTITNACKMAVKAGDPLTMEEMSGLLEQLAETENPYLCPHGRPIVVTVSLHELDRLFKRA